jgi:hypothetical protein
MQTADWPAVLGTVATIFSVAIAGYALWRQLAVLRSQMVIQHFSDYARRYAEIMERFPERVHEQQCSLNDLGDTAAVMPIMRTFFYLCFEEWALHQRGYYDPKMWSLWHLGMHNALAKPAFRQAWERIASDTQFGARFIHFMAEEIAAATKPQTV